MGFTLEKVVQAIVVESKEWDEEGKLIKTFILSETAPLFETLQISLNNRAKWLEIVEDWESKKIYVRDGKLIPED